MDGGLLPELLRQVVEPLQPPDLIQQPFLIALLCLLQAAPGIVDVLWGQEVSGQGRAWASAPETPTAAPCLPGGDSFPSWPSPAIPTQPHGYFPGLLSTGHLGRVGPKFIWATHLWSFGVPALWGKSPRPCAAPGLISNRILTTYRACSASQVQRAMN